MTGTHRPCLICFLVHRGSSCRVVLFEFDCWCSSGGGGGGDGGDRVSGSDPDDVVDDDVGISLDDALVGLLLLLLL